MDSFDRGAPAFSDREDRKRKVATTLREHQQHEETGWKVEAVADHIGCSETYLYHCADPHKAKSATLSVGDAMALPLETRLALARLIAGPGFQVVQEPSFGENLPDDLALVEESMQQHNDVIRVLMGAVRAGAATRAVGVELERECDEAVRPILRIREIGRAAQREGVIGMRNVVRMAVSK